MEDPSTVEFRLLEGVVEGLRREAEAADGAPDFLLLHSLGGGSGSGLGSRILEHVREVRATERADWLVGGGGRGVGMTALQPNPPQFA